MTLSLYARIRTDIEGRILSGALPPGARLQTEHELMGEYGCSRMTVNKALSALAVEGLIDRRKRAGSFVARPRLHSMVLDIPDLPQQVLARKQTYAFKLLSRKIMRANSARETYFDVGPGKIIELSGLHLADDRPLAVEYRIISLAVAPNIDQATFEDEPPGTWLLRNIPWTQAETRISALTVDEITGPLLLLDAGSPLLQIERRTWRGRDRITAVRQLFRADSYDLFARFNARDSADR